MITDAVLDLLQALAELLIGLVPLPEDTPDSSNWTAASARITSEAGWVNYFLPIGFAAWCALAVLTWSLTCWSVSTLFTVARRVRLIG